MTDNINTIILPTDAQVFGLFELLSKKYEKPYVFCPIGGQNIASTDEARRKKICTENLSIIKTASMTFPGFNINYYGRSIRKINANGHLGLDNHPYYSTITIDPGENPNQDQIASVVIDIGRYIRDEKLLPIAATPDGSSLSEAQHSLLTSLQASAADQIRKTNEFFGELTDRFDERNRLLDERLAAKTAEMEKKYLEKEADLQASRDALDKLKGELDDRSNMHARRAIRGELITILKGRQDEFKISPETTRLRIPIHIIFVCLLISMLLGAIWSLYVWGVNPADTWGPVAVTSGLKTAIFGFGFLTSAGLYISWMNKWFDKHSNAQFQTKQTEIDFNRASWAVEAALEWKSAQNEQIPDALLDRITRNLFDGSREENSEYSPMEAIANGLLGSASSLKLNMGGNEVNFDRKAMKKLKEQD